MEFEMNRALEILTETPAVLRALLNGKSDAWLNARREKNTFSAIDVLGHLIHAEETDWIPRARLIVLYRDSKPFEPFDRFAFKEIIADRSVRELLDKFAQLRKDNLAVLHGFDLTERELDLPGLHPELGPVTMSNLLATWAVHDLGHISQITKIFANEYRDAVGPWRAFTTILHS